MSSLKSNGKLTEEYKKVILSDKSTYELVNNDIELNKENIIRWCNKNQLNENMVLSFITKYGEYLLNQFNIENSKLFEWSSNLSSNFNKLLTDYTIEERIVRSFIYGKPMQFAILTKNSLIFLHKYQIVPD